MFKRYRQKKPLRNRTVGQYKRLMHGAEKGNGREQRERRVDSKYRDESVLANRAPFSSFTYTTAAGNGIANPTTLHASWQLVISRPVLRQHTPRYVPHSFPSLVVMSRARRPCRFTFQCKSIRSTSRFYHSNFFLVFLSLSISLSFSHYFSYVLLDRFY